MASDQYSDKKIVWVLGSGFSVPLGGPTLNDLLSPSYRRILSKIFEKSSFPNLYNDNYLHWSYKIYNTGRNETSTLPRMWFNAEEYIDYLDTAAKNPKSQANYRIEAVIQNAKLSREPIDINELSITTRRIIAAECSVFLQNISTELEEWQPYKQWARQLKNYNHDTIITFNYDRVLENLVNIKGIGHLGKNSFLTPPFRTPLLDDFVSIIFKLHGSVDWKRKEPPNIPGAQKIIIETGNDLEALECETDELCIATPGPTKHEMVSDVFSPLWYKAEISLRNADAVVFMGYRFPPTDANARDKLLGALMQNESLDLRIFTVLGPDDNPDNRRLEALLKYATSRKPNGKATVTRLPLWAQDFMSLYTPEMLFE